MGEKHNQITFSITLNTTYYGRFTMTSGITVNVLFNNFKVVIFVGRYVREPRKRVHDDTSIINIFN